MKCKKCKEEIPDGSLFCNWCGFQQHSVRDQIKIPPPEKMESGSYHGRLLINGKRVSITTKTQEEYYAKAKSYKLKEIAVADPTMNVTLGEAIDSYITTYETVLSPATIRGYKTCRSQLEIYANHNINKVDYQKVISYYSKKYSSKTVRNLWGIISASLKELGSEVPKVKLPAKEVSERAWLDYEQIPVFLSAIKGKPCELACILALHSLRVSEIYALTKDSVDGKTIKVRGAVVPSADGKMVRKTTNKNETSTRDVPVMIPRLLELWDYNKDPKFSSDVCINRGIARACDKVGLPKVTIHSLRHSFCSLARSLGWDIKVTCKTGGWKNELVPSQIYSHIPTKTENTAIKTMQDYYGQLEYFGTEQK